MKSFIYNGKNLCDKRSKIARSSIIFRKVVFKDQQASSFIQDLSPVEKNHHWNCQLRIFGMLFLAVFCFINTQVFGYNNIKNDSVSISSKMISAYQSSMENSVQYLKPERSMFQNVLKKGDQFYFGMYEQDNNFNNGSEYILWRVLDTNEYEALVISEYVLDAKKYHNSYCDVTWETSDIRNWLNSDFLYNAFSSTERNYITKKLLTNSDNRETGSDGGHDTYDSIFLLDYDEAKKYFASDKDRQGYPTIYALRMGVYLSDKYLASWWWLRSPGKDNKWAGDVGASGGLYRNGTQINYSGSNGYGGIRPAFWIRYR